MLGDRLMVRFWELSAQELPVAEDAANHVSGYQFSVKVNVKKAIAS
jgi:hypothetical protein